MCNLIFKSFKSILTIYYSLQFQVLLVHFSLSEAKPSYNQDRVEVIKWEVDGPALTFTPKGKTSAVSQKSTSKGTEGIEEGGVSRALPTAQGTLHPDAPPSAEKSINEAPKSTMHSKALEETSSKSCVWFKIKFEIKKVFCMH